MNASTPFWAWGRDNPAARDPRCQAAAADLRDITERALARRKGVVIDESAPWGLRVQAAGAEMEIVIQPTGVLEKTCASTTCENKFWRSEGGIAVAKYCSERCKNQQKARDFRARKAGGSVQPVSRILSRVLTQAGYQRASRSNPEGFEVHRAARGNGVTVTAPASMLAGCAQTLKGLGYAVKRRRDLLVVTAREGKGAAA